LKTGPGTGLLLQKNNTKEKINGLDVNGNAKSGPENKKEIGLW